MWGPMPLPSPPGVHPLGLAVLRPRASHWHGFGNAGESRDLGAGWAFLGFFQVDSADLDPSPHNANPA